VSKHIPGPGQDPPLLLQQRDDLLAALKRIVVAYSINENTRAEFAYKTARAAIRAATAKVQS
jgi:hypothetical protein